MLVPENYSDCPFVWCQNLRSALFGFVAKHTCDRQTEKQTDRETDRITTPKTALAQLRHAVKTKLQHISFQHVVTQRQQGINRHQTPPPYRNAASGSRLKVKPSTHCHTAHYGQTWRHPWHPQNRKYITYRNAAKGGPSHGHGICTKILWRSVQRFQRYARRQTDTQTD